MFVLNMFEFSKIVKKTKKDDNQAQGLTVMDKPSVEGGPQEQSAAQKPINPLFTLPNKRIFAAGPGAAYPSSAQPQNPPPAAAQAALPAAAENKRANAYGLYQRMLVQAKNFFREGIDYKEEDIRGIIKMISEAAALIGEGDETLAELAVTYILKEEDSYLFQHCVNVCVISLVVAGGLNYVKEKLEELGLAACLHDIGMTNYQDMAQLPRKLSAQELEEVKKHVEAGRLILKKMQGVVGETVLVVQDDVHEYLDGSGYPSGKRVVHDYARIIALADCFESMIHPRPFRERYSIMEVYKRIFDVKEKYDQNFMKILVEKIGFFPNGSFVCLNTKESGRVMRQNPKSPLRPVVRIEYGAEGQKLYAAEVKEISLVEYPTIHIKKCFLENIERI